MIYLIIALYVLPMVYLYYMFVKYYDYDEINWRHVAGTFLPFANLLIALMISIGLVCQSKVWEDIPKIIFLKKKKTK